MNGGALMEDDEGAAAQIEDRSFVEEVNLNKLAFLPNFQLRCFLRVRDVEGAVNPEHYVDPGVHCTGVSKSNTRFYAAVLTAESAGFS